MAVFCEKQMKLLLCLSHLHCSVFSLLVLIPFNI